MCPPTIRVCQQPPQTPQPAKVNPYGVQVGVIGNLVHSSQHIKKAVLDEGALQPVISLLRYRGDGGVGGGGMGR